MLNDRPELNCIPIAAVLLPSTSSLRKLTTQASFNYVTNNHDRLDTRDGTARAEAEFTNSDLLSVA